MTFRAALLLSALTPFLLASARAENAPQKTETATPIRHLVVIYQENVSFDHYFGTYPSAVNPRGEPTFQARSDTPHANTLVTADLLLKNPNSRAENGKDASLPFRLDRTQASTADQNHAYSAEQQAYHHGLADLFPRYTGRGTPGGVGAFSTRGQVMGYFDGNTVTALELCPELRHERCGLYRYIRSIHTGCARSRVRPDEWHDDREVRTKALHA